MTPERRNAPYAPPSNVLAVIRRFRERNLPDVINIELLQDLGISKGNVHRTQAALQFLGLVGEDGIPSDVFRSIQIATDEEYSNILEGLVRTAYRDVFQIVDPSKDAQNVIDNHFRRYQPTSQRSRMVTLFLALCREAGIATLEPPRERSFRGGRGGVMRSRVTSGTHRGRSGDTDAQIGDGPSPSQGVSLPVVSNLRATYIAALIEQVRQTAAHGREVDTELLDRIEKLLAEEERQQQVIRVEDSEDEP